MSPVVVAHIDNTVNRQINNIKFVLQM